MQLSKTHIVRRAGARNEAMAETQRLLNEYLKMYAEHYARAGDAAEAEKYNVVVQVNGDPGDRKTYSTLDNLLSLRAGRDYRNYNQLLELMRSTLAEHKRLLAEINQKPTAQTNMRIAPPHPAGSPTINNGKPALMELEPPE